MAEESLIAPEAEIIYTEYMFIRKKKKKKKNFFYRGLEGYLGETNRFQGQGERDIIPSK